MTSELRRGPGRGSLWAGSVGAIFAVSLFVLSSVAGGAVPAGAFPGGSWNATLIRSQGGCASTKETTPTFSLQTGVGHWSGSGSAHSCGASRGGPTIQSSGYVSGTVTVTVPVAIGPMVNHGVNVSWTLDLKARDAAALHNTTVAVNCPVTTYQYDYSYGYTWFNYTVTNSYCFAEAYVSISGYPLLLDTTSGAYFLPRNSWVGLYNVSGISNQTYTYSVTYSNSSYWTYNTSYGYTSNYSWGSPGSVSGTFSPKWFFNGTFKAKDSFVIETYVSATAYVAIQGFPAATAFANVNMQGPGNSEVLDPIQVW